MATIKVGDKLPSVIVHENTPADQVDIAELFKGKKGILFGVPGAFTPGCHKSHLPGYIEDFDKFQAKGVELIACIAVNDAFVMGAWGEASKAAGKIRMLADTHCKFAEATGLVLDATPFLGNKRCKRFAMVVNDGVVTTLAIEPDGKGLCTSLSGELLKQL